MKIVYLPDANLTAMLSALIRLGGSFCMEQALVRNKRARAALICVEQYLRDLERGRIDCQTPVRANRSVLELVRDEASLISELSYTHAVCEAAEDIVYHLSPSFLETLRTEPLCNI